MEWVTTTAKTLPEAIDLALDNLGVDESEAEIVVLEEPSKGLFGRMRGSARVEARVKPRAIRPKNDRGRSRRTRSNDGGRGRGGRGRGRNESRGSTRNTRNSSGNRSNEKSKDTSSNRSDGNGNNGGGQRRRGGGSGGGGQKTGDSQQAQENKPAKSTDGNGNGSGGSGGSKSGAKAKGKSGRAGKNGGDGGKSEGNTTTDEQVLAQTGTESGSKSGGRRRNKSGGKSDSGGNDSGNGNGNGKSQVKNKTEKTNRADEKVIEETPMEEVAEHLRTFLGGLTEAFGLEGDVAIDDSEADVLVATVEGQHGLMVGPKGRTLDAIQELARVSSQRAAPSSIRIRVDVGGYRTQRAAALAHFARKAADKAIDNAAEVSLEPMSPADRKSVHDALSDDDRVETRSVGTEPRRRIIVIPTVDASAAESEEE